MRPPVGYAYLGNGVGITFTHRGHKILVYTSDFGLTPHIVLHGEWERAIEEAVLRQVKPGGTVIEVGCNMGYHTLAMSDKLGSNGTLYGFEANPEIFRLLHWTMDLNGFRARAKLFNHAVTEVPGDVSFQFEPIAVGGGNVVQGTATAGATVITVPGAPLDTTLAGVGNVDLLRMDAEGFEPAIVKGGLGILDRSPNVVIVCEWSVPMMASRTDLRAYVQMLFDRGFRSWKVNSDASLSSVSQEELLSIPHCEIVFCRQSPS
ncbi:MAG: FkbM family methyltransferase [Hyphomonadaceae bacterium]|nr:FkbM family methyltransferase [Hyphomonadaceae bacterium]